MEGGGELTVICGHSQHAACSRLRRDDMVTGACHKGGSRRVHASRHKTTRRGARPPHARLPPLPLRLPHWAAEPALGTCRSGSMPPPDSQTGLCHRHRPGWGPWQGHRGPGAGTHTWLACEGCGEQVKGVADSSIGGGEEIPCGAASSRACRTPSQVCSGKFVLHSQREEL